MMNDECESKNRRTICPHLFIIHHFAFCIYFRGSTAAQRRNPLCGLPVVTLRSVNSASICLDHSGAMVLRCS